MSRTSAIGAAILASQRQPHGTNQHGPPKLTAADVRLARLMHQQGYVWKAIWRKMPSSIALNTIKRAVRGDTYKGIK